MSEHARKAIDFVVRAPAPLLAPHLQVPMAVLRVFASAAVALVPRHLRAIAGIDRPFWQDAAAMAAAVPLAAALSLPGLRELALAILGTESATLWARGLSAAA